jgi:hypothetical protein
LENRHCPDDLRGAESFTNIDTYLNAYGDGYGHSDSKTESNTDGNTNCYRNSDANGWAAGYAHSKVSSYSAAAPVACQSDLAGSQRCIAGQPKSLDIFAALGVKDVYAPKRKQSESAH